MLDETDNFTEYLTSDKGKWAMQYIDRAETLWDECKQLISDSAYEDLDGIEERLGFSYDGPRAYNSSIKLLGKDEFVEVKREIESGIAVKCEVTKNVTHYVQVRIIGFSEIGSIYVNELVEPYSANNRPDIGTILDGKILMKKFDNAKHCNVWQITMNMNDIKEESKEETAMAQAIRLSGIKVR